jgi:hypothetical protein
VYLLDSTRGGTKTASSQLTPATIRVGITDGAFTEVREGLKEGDVIVTGTATVSATASETPAAGQNNPFAPRRPPRR